jgi:cell division protein FtsW
LNDASRWITIPGINQSFQTSDLAKVVLLVYLARVLSRTEEVFASFQAFLLKAGLPVGLICGLIFPANFSTAALLFMVCLMIMFIAKTPIKYMVGLVGVGTVALLLLVSVNSLMADEHKFLGRSATWEARMDRFVNGTEDRDANYQVEHAKIAIASGGLLPNGPGQGVSRNFLPHPYSDMIYAFIIEEYGSILGGFGLLFLYLVLFLRACHVANRSERMFGSLVAMGLSTSLVLQALVNMAVAVNLVPVTGQPLPLVSMGGTSIWFTCLAIGILLSVSKATEETKSNVGGHSKRTAFA